MLKWLLTFVLACALFSAAIPLLKRLGIGTSSSVLFFGFGFWLIGRLV